MPTSKMKKLFAISEYMVKRFIPEQYQDQMPEIEVEDTSKYSRTMSVHDLAEAHGLTSFDVALPVDWVLEFQNQTGFRPVGHIVMDYSRNTLGIPKPITAEGRVAYKIFLHVNNIDMG